MDKEDLRRADRRGQAAEKVQLRPEGLSDGGPEPGLVQAVLQGQPQGQPHLHQHAAVPEKTEIVVVKGRGQLLPAVQEAGHQVVAVAAQHVHPVPALQLHDILQRLQAPRPLLHNVTQHKEGVLRPKAHLLQRPLQQIPRAVNVADGKHPPRLRQSHIHNRRFDHRCLTPDVQKYPLFYHSSRQKTTAGGKILRRTGRKGRETSFPKTAAWRRCSAAGLWAAGLTGTRPGPPSRSSPICG